MFFACTRGSSLGRQFVLPFMITNQTRTFVFRARVLAFVLMATSIVAPFVAAQKIEVSVDASKTGAKIDRNIFGQFAEHLGHGIYEGIWVGPNSTIPNTRGIRNDVVAALKAIQGAQRSLARRMLRRRISLAKRSGQSARPVLSIPTGAECSSRTRLGPTNSWTSSIRLARKPIFP